MVEQYGWRWMLEVSGIPVKENEDCIDIITNLLPLLDLFDLFIKNIDIAHQIPSKTKTNLDIFISFKTRSSRDIFFANRSKLKEKSIKDLGFPKPNINQSTTQ